MTPVRTAVTLFAVLTLVALAAFPAPAIHPFDSPPAVSSIATAVDSAPVQPSPDIVIAPDIAIQIDEQSEQASMIPARKIAEPMTEASSQYQRALFRTTDGFHTLRKHWRLT